MNSLLFIVFGNTWVLQLILKKDTDMAKIF